MMTSAAAEFPRVALGCMYYGTRIDQATAFRLLDMFKDAGETLLDTSNNYAFWEDGSRGGASESLMGRWLAQPGRRDGMRVATKVGARPLQPGGGFEVAEGLSARSVRAAVEESLQRLRLESIDLYYAHIDDRTVPLEETLGVFADLIAEGKIQAIGASNMRASRLREALDISARQGIPAYSVLQQRHSLLLPIPGSDFDVQEPTTPELLDLLIDEQVALLAYSPLLEGGLVAPERLLPTNYDSDENRRRRQELAASATELNIPISRLALAILIEQHVTPLLGASTPEQLADSLAARDVRVGEALERKLSPHRDLKPVPSPVGAV